MGSIGIMTGIRSSSLVIFDSGACLHSHCAVVLLCSLTPTCMCSTPAAHPFTLQSRPPREFLEDFLGASLMSLPSHSAQALSNTAWSLASLRVQPSQAWLEAYWQVRRR